MPCRVCGVGPFASAAEQGEHCKSKLHKKVAGGMLAYFIRERRDFVEWGVTETPEIIDRMLDEAQF